MRRPLYFLLLVVCGIVLDQLTKSLAFSQIPLEHTRPVIDGIFHFSPVHNKGVAFSLGAKYPLLIKGFTICAVIGLAVWYAITWRSASKLLIVALAFLLSGAIGNLIDRMLFDYVLDFLDFRPELPVIGHWAIFNVADIFICVGVGLLVLESLWPEPKPTLSPAPVSGVSAAPPAVAPAPAAPSAPPEKHTSGA